MVQGVLGGLRPAVVAMIASAGLSIVFLAFFGSKALPASIDSVQWISVIIFAIGLFILRKWHLNPIVVMVGSGVAGVILYGLAG